MASASGIAEQLAVKHDNRSEKVDGGVSVRLVSQGRPNEPSLASLPSFSELGPEDVSLLESKTSVISVMRGTVLLRQGDPSDRLYLVLSGRFFVMPEGKQEVIAEIGPGEPLGELAFFAGVERTANVVAARDSKVLMLTREAYADVTRQVPGIVSTILSAVADRLARATGNSPALRPRPACTIALLPIGGLASIPPRFTDMLVEAVAPGKALAISRRTFAGSADDDEFAWRNRLATFEDQTDLLLFDLENDGRPFTRACLSFADQILLVAHASDRSAAAIAPSAFESHAASLFLPSHRALVVLRDRAADPIAGTLAWLEHRDVQLHHHLALDDRRDYERLGRFLRGTAVGLVLSSGTALGCAHLGVAKALQEAGEPIDILGGASVGAAMGGALALGLPPDEIVRMTQEMFVENRAMRRLTIPFHSLLDHVVFDKFLRKFLNGTNIEDLPINYFALSASLTDNEARVHRRGPTWEAVRASGAIPGMLPPFITRDGDILVDGGLIDSVPVSAMHDLKIGPNVVVRLRSPQEWRVSVGYDSFPTRGGVLRELLFGWRNPAYPSLGAVLMRSMAVSSDHHAEDVDPATDFCIVPRGAAGMGFLEWQRGPELAEAAYRHMAELLAEAGSLKALIESQGSRAAA